MPGPFTTAQAAADGLSEAALRTRAVRREHHGVYVDARQAPRVELSVAAARLVLPADAVLDGVSALHALGVAVGDARPLRFASAHRHQVRRPGIRVRRVRSLPPVDAHSSCATAEAAFVAAARELDLVDAVAAGDWLGRSTPTRLCDAAAAHRGRGAVVARRASALVRERVDSVQETRLRLCLVLAGLPEPQVNPVVLSGGRARSAASTCSSHAGASRSRTRATSTVRTLGSGTSTSDATSS